MARWVTNYIDENQDRWEKEKKARETDARRKAEDWHKMQRFEKIRMLKETYEEKEAAKKIKAVMKPTVLGEIRSHESDREDGNQAEDSHVTTDWPASDDQAEHSHVTPDWPACDDQAEHSRETPDWPAYDDQAEHSQETQDWPADDDQAEQLPEPVRGGREEWPLDDHHDDQAEQRQPQTCPSSSLSTPDTVTQPLAKLRAVARCVKFHDQLINIQPLTSNKLGTGARTPLQDRDKTDRAEQDCSSTAQVGVPGDVPGPDQPAAVDDAEDLPASITSTHKPAKILQPLTITRVLCRCVSVHDHKTNDQLLTPNISGQPSRDAHHPGDDQPNRLEDDHRDAGPGGPPQHVVNADHHTAQQHPPTQTLHEEHLHRPEVGSRLHEHGGHPQHVGNADHHAAQQPNQACPTAQTLNEDNLHHPEVGHRDSAHGDHHQHVVNDGHHTAQQPTPAQTLIEEYVHHPKVGHRDTAHGDHPQYVGNAGHHDAQQPTPEELINNLLLQIIHSIEVPKLPKDDHKHVGHPNLPRHPPTSPQTSTKSCTHRPLSTAKTSNTLSTATPPTRLTNLTQPTLPTRPTNPKPGTNPDTQSCPPRLPSLSTSSICTATTPTRLTNHNQPTVPTRPANPKPIINPASQVYVDAQSCAPRLLRLATMQPKAPARLTSQNPPILPTKPANPSPEVGPITPSRKPTHHINQLRDVWSPNLKLSQPTLETRPPTPKRKRVPEPTKPKSGPKIGPEKCTKNPSKKNPHPQNKHKIFMNIQGQIQLLTHQGLATSSRRKFRRRNLQENSPPQPPLTTHHPQRPEKEGVQTSKLS